MAFLDIMPLTRGHVLVAPRKHYGMLGDLGVTAGQEVCIFSSTWKLFQSLSFIALFLRLRPALTDHFLVDGQMASHHFEGRHENRVWRRPRQALECCPEQRYVPSSTIISQTLSVTIGPTRYFLITLLVEEYTVEGSMRISNMRA